MPSANAPVRKWMSYNLPTLEGTFQHKLACIILCQIIRLPGCTNHLIPHSVLKFDHSLFSQVSWHTVLPTCVEMNEHFNLQIGKTNESTLLHPFEVRRRQTCSEGNKEWKQQVSFWFSLNCWSNTIALSVCCWSVCCIQDATVSSMVYPLLMSNDLSLIFFIMWKVPLQWWIEGAIECYLMLDGSSCRCNSLANIWEHCHKTMRCNRRNLSCISWFSGSADL